MKHTPASWKAENIENYDLHYVADENGNSVCDLYIKIGKDEEPTFHRFENAETNVHLLAAARDLLEAVNRVLRSQHFSIDHERNRTPEACDIRDILVAAADKAEGR